MSLLDLNFEENAEGWGPSTPASENFEDIRFYTPFNKNDKLGKAANYVYQEEDSNFQLVENTKAQQPKRTFGHRTKFQQRPYQHYTQNAPKKYQPQQKKQWNRYAHFRGKWSQEAQPRKRDLSIEVKSDWKLITNIELKSLDRLNPIEEPTAEDLKECGELLAYNKAYDRRKKPLNRAATNQLSVTTSSDPVLNDLSSQKKGTVFAIDIIVSHLMSCARSVEPWDLTITKKDNQLFFDKRDGKIQFDLLTVNETAPVGPSDEGKDPAKDPNSLTNLVKEATFINQWFLQQVLTKEESSHKLSEPNPFIKSTDKNPAIVGYKYRKWHLSENIELVSRCQIDGFSKGPRGDSFLTIRALNEWDSKTEVDWRKKIDTQPAAIVITELPNNACKLSKWTCQALLAGTQFIKLGFVSRLEPKDNLNHVILGTQEYDPKEFAQQINLNVKNAWAVVKYLCELCFQQEDGKYVLLRDNEKDMLRLYQLPQ